MILISETTRKELESLPLTPPQRAVLEAKEVWLAREATGLVRVWSKKGSFVYSERTKEIVR